MNDHGGEMLRDEFGVVDRLPQSGLSFYSLARFGERHGPAVQRLPRSIRVLLEAVLHAEDGERVTADDVRAFAGYDPENNKGIDLPFKPARVLLQDFTGVPCVVDLAAMRSAVARAGGDPSQINPELPVDLVIDHSVQVDAFGRPDALAINTQMEFERNQERYAFLRWGQKAFKNFAVVPPNCGICHQVHLEYLGQVVRREGDVVIFDTLVGTDSHTPMINGLGVIGWGVGGIEAEAAMLGHPISMTTPSVVGVRISGRPRPGITATDIVLRVTELLRARGVVGKFVEFFGPGLPEMSVPDRATIANMAPEYGATVGFFPPDARTLEYLEATGRSREQIALVEEYTRAQGIFVDSDASADRAGDGAPADAAAEPVFESVVELDLSQIEPSIAGPKRPQDRIALSAVAKTWTNLLAAPVDRRGYAVDEADRDRRVEAVFDSGQMVRLGHGDVVIAAITSCTNTSNPAVLIGAGLVAKAAVERGLTVKPWVKTSFSPGSVVVTEYMRRTGLMPYLDALGFHLVGYGCTTCIGNSGPLPDPVRAAVEEGNLVVAGVLSGNRNFEGRINPHTRANFLMSPPLVVAYALAGSIAVDLASDPIGTGRDGKPVYLCDLWPDDDVLGAMADQALDRDAFLSSYRGIESSNATWNEIATTDDAVYPWDSESTYIQEPPFFVDIPAEPAPIAPIVGARALVWVGDSTTTDHISPAGAIDPESPAGRYLLDHGVDVASFNSYGSRRGNDRVMTRGTFANIRLRNTLAPGTEGGWTRHVPSGDQIPIFDAAERYRAEGVPCIIIAGKDYGMGSSRDWAAKGSRLLGVRAVIAESYERIHRSNLVGMGVLPLEFAAGESAASLGLTGAERFSVAIDDTVQPRSRARVTAEAEDGTRRDFEVAVRLDSVAEVAYLRHGGILNMVLRRFLSR